MHAYGAAFDNPDLLVACVVGDGEAESDAAASWHSNKFLNPARDGAVLPILHLNGYKLSGPALLARMSDGEELRSLFTGYGYHVRFVSGDDQERVHREMWPALDWAHHEIRSLQGAARRGEILPRPNWPLLILRTPKGWTGPKTLDGVPIEGTFHSHQIPIKDPAANPAHLKQLENWLRSYRPEELFDASGRPAQQVTAICPQAEKRMGSNPHANGGALLEPLRMPDYAAYAVEVSSPGSVDAENTRVSEACCAIFSAITGRRVISGCSVRMRPLRINCKTYLTPRYEPSNGRSLPPTNISPRTAGLWRFSVSTAARVGSKAIC